MVMMTTTPLASILLFIFYFFFLRLKDIITPLYALVCRILTLEADIGRHGVCICLQHGLVHGRIQMVHGLVHCRVQMVHGLHSRCIGAQQNKSWAWFLRS
jgi:hypothetical protein